jgi:hypothetical protein
MWMCFSDQKAHVPQSILTRVTTAYGLIANNLGEGENPIQKKPIVITGDGDTVYLTELNGSSNQSEQPFPMTGQSQTEMSMALMSNQMEMRQMMVEQNARMDQMFERSENKSERQFRMVFAILRQLAAEPTRRHAAGMAVGTLDGPQQLTGDVIMANGINPKATLSPTRKHLVLLWREYEEGLDGRKAAKLFTREERGRVKDKYSRRKVVWKLMQRLIDAGHSHFTAADLIYRVYGQNSSVTQIINRLKEDLRNKSLHVDLL